MPCACAMKENDFGLFERDDAPGLRLLVWLWLGLLWLAHLGRKDDKDKSNFPLGGLVTKVSPQGDITALCTKKNGLRTENKTSTLPSRCLLYTSDAADERS